MEQQCAATTTPENRATNSNRVGLVCNVGLWDAFDQAIALAISLGGPSDSSGHDIADWYFRAGAGGRDDREGEFKKEKRGARQETQF